jgi:hypothetical protein
MAKLTRQEQDKSDRLLGEQVRLAWAEGAKLIRGGKRSRVVVASVRREGKGVVYLLVRPGLP